MEHKEKLIRVLQILETTDEKSPMNTTKIIERLKLQYGMDNVNRRSIYDDIAILQNCGYPIWQCENKKSGWYMKNHLFADWELKIMMDAVEQAKGLDSDKFYDFKKRISSITSERGMRKLMYNVYESCQCSTGSNMSITYVETFLEAIYQKKKIQFRYTELDERLSPILRRDGYVYTFNLYEIVWANGYYYLIGAHDKYSELTMYRHDRIRDLTMIGEDAVPIEEKLGENYRSKLNEYISKSVNHFSGNKIKIELIYEPDPVTNAILYDFAAGDVKVQKMKDGKYKAIMQKMDSVTLVGWLMQYADRFVVASPESLYEQVKKAIDVAKERYDRKGE